MPYIIQKSHTTIFYIISVRIKKNLHFHLNRQNVYEKLKKNFTINRQENLYKTGDQVSYFFKKKPNGIT